MDRGIFPALAVSLLFFVLGIFFINVIFLRYLERRVVVSYDEELAYSSSDEDDEDDEDKDNIHYYGTFEYRDRRDI